MPRVKGVRMMGALALVLGLAACAPPFSDPGEVATVSKVSSTTEDGWRYDFYRNAAYPCSISGYQTFTIATQVDAAKTETHPLWVYMHGGGVGYFSPDGVPRAAEGRESAMWMTEESAEDLRAEFSKGELMRRIREEPAGFRMMAVSMCNRDIYGGDDTADPNNPNTTPDGQPRTANGYFATKAAVEYAQDLYPTDDYFLHGTSAGSYGSYSVAWGLERQGLAPTGTVSDSGVLNPPWIDAQVDGENCAPPRAAQAIINERLHPEIADPENAPDLLVARGELTVPILQLWTQGDFLGCGLKPMQCPLRNGTTPTMGSVDCQNELMRATIAAQGPESRSLSMRLCVDRPQTAMPCDMHVPTAREALNADPAWPADFTAPIMDWVRARQADAGLPVPPTGPSAE